MRTIFQLRFTSPLAASEESSRGAVLARCEDADRTGPPLPCRRTGPGSGWFRSAPLHRLVAAVALPLPVLLLFAVYEGWSHGFPT